MDRTAPTTVSPTGLADQLPLVSVVITNHNYARYLRACFDSVQAQAYPRIECIVVDDRSTDDSAAVLDAIEAAAPRFKTIVLRATVNAGQYGAMRKGFAASSGQFVVFLDADDLLGRGFRRRQRRMPFERQASMPRSRPPTSGSSMARGACSASIRAGSIFGSWRCPSDLLTRHAIESAALGLAFEAELIAADANWAGFWIWGTTSSMMFRRDVLALIMAEEIEMRISADDFLANFAHAIGGTAVIDRVLGSYRRHGANNFADNLVLGGFVPLMRDRRTRQHTPRSHIARLPRAPAGALSRGAGRAALRRYRHALLRRAGRGSASCARNRVRRDYTFSASSGETSYMRIVLWAQGYRRDFCWITFRRPTYW